MLFYEVSALNGLNLDKALEEIMIVGWKHQIEETKPFLYLNEVIVPSSNAVINKDAAKSTIWSCCGY